MAGKLVVVATPIGNLGDLSARAAATLVTADIVLAEDTRHTGRLLAHVGAGAPQMSLHEHNERERVAEVLARLADGETIALVSDAGTPLVSDPGHRVVVAAIEAGHHVEPVPGPSAVLAALVVAGLPTDRVAFEGFLPRKGSARAKRLEQLAREERTMVVFVAVHRVAADLADLALHLGGDRRASMSRELTKLHEETVRGTLGDLTVAFAAKSRGELTLVIEGAPQMTISPDDADIVAALARLTSRGMSTRDAVDVVSDDRGVSRRRVYELAVGND
ncbi:MAG: 16S rRNA (cytidine(1402)-2'-O)-methyltransferase [Nitriliruptoraceae bacterium]